MFLCEWAYRLPSKEFRLYINKLIYNETGSPLSEKGLKELVHNLEFLAYDSPVEQVYTRVAKIEDSFYIDLANDNGDVLNVSKNGQWRVDKCSNVNFYRPQGLLPLPYPEENEDITVVKELIFSSWDSSGSFFLLILAFLIKSLTVETGPYPILCIIGLQGSGKSVLSSMLKRFIDPNRAALRSPPDKVDDLMLSGRNAHLICIDNISNLSAKLSDACCSISTGAGYSTRKLYTNDEEFLISIIKPILINGISSPTNRPDFLERSLVIDLPQLGVRKTQQVLDDSFEKNKGKVMGYLLHLLAQTYKKVNSIQLKNPPRMADFAQWGTAMCVVLGHSEDHFMELYKKNNKDLAQETFDNSPLANAISTLLEQQRFWKGKASQLLSQIKEDFTLEHLHSDKFFPKTPEAIGKGLRRIAPVLSQNGYEVKFGKRSITIENTLFSEGKEMSDVST